MAIPDPITRGWLESQHACAEQIAVFVALFGESAPLTRANLRRAAAAELSLDWLVDRLDARETRRFLRGTRRAWRRRRRVILAASRHYNEVMKIPCLSCNDLLHRTTLDFIWDGAPTRDLQGEQLAAARLFEEAFRAADRAFLLAVAEILADVLGLASQTRRDLRWYALRSLIPLAGLAEDLAGVATLGLWRPDWWSLAETAFLDHTEMLTRKEKNEPTEDQVRL